MKKLGVLAIVLVLLLGAAALAGNKKEEEQQYSSLAFVVLKEDGGKPIRNAAVVLHPVDKNGRQTKGGVELKTDAEGKASFDSVPYGKLRVQVIMTGFQTYGEDFEVNQPQQEITVKLKHPQQQYSIYK
jgi:uncharacterized GH25 family protein